MVKMAKESASSIPGTVAIPPHPSVRWRVYILAGLVLVLLITAATATAFGTVKVPFLTVINVLLSKIPLIGIQADYPATLGTIIIDIRLPRVILAGLVGASLALAGGAYQGLFRNPLADPYLIGVAQGASLGAVAGFMLPVSIMGPALIPLLAFCGALLSTVIVYSLARVGKTLPVSTLILAGVALSALLGSAVSYLIIASGDKLHGIIFWLMGSFSLSNWPEVRILLPYILAGTVVILVYSRPLNIMQLDEEQAHQLGVDVERLKLILLAASTMIVAASVAFAGTIGFVGIIIPHAVRLIWGPDYRFLLPFSVVTGAVFMILADLAARTLLAPTEIPIGVITALCGAPFFLYLLRSRRRVIF